AKISPTATTIIASRSPMVGGIVAEGTKMLGYNMMNATPASNANSFISGGLPTWNNTIAGAQVAEGSDLGLLTVSAYTAPAKVDITAPVINNTTGTAATGSTTANVVRNTSEPATSKIALTGSGGAPAVNVNNTVLNASKTTALTGLVPGTTYTGTLTVCDAQANSASTPISFTTTAAPVSDWNKVKGFIAAYISSQYIAGDEGEAGFVASAASLNYRINSLNDTAILGEGDDAASAPVLVDNLGAGATYIPGTSTRCVWNSGAGLTGNTANCFDQAVIDVVKARADAHAAAGFSTDVIVYCQSGHTQSAATGAFGYIAQTGALRSDGSIPKVYGLKWGRNGWTNSIAAYDAANPIAAASAVSTYTPPTTNPDATACNST
ncbi:MAG: hypothetical protein AABZ63_08025, partial [Actinomycetota bacterium]